MFFGPVSTPFPCCIPRSVTSAVCGSTRAAFSRHKGCIGGGRKILILVPRHCASFNRAADVLPGSDAIRCICMLRMTGGCRGWSVNCMMPNRVCFYAIL